MTIDYKDTLNLPKTDFPMKANLAQREPETLKHWQSIKLVQQLKEKGQAKPAFILADGPPYANGPIHLGHAVNKILKDFVLKVKTLGGFYAPYVPGWDCHGLPIELNVEKKSGKPGHKIDAKTFREKCREYGQAQVNLQRDAFIRLGVLGDFENPYLTMDYQYEADIVRAVGKIASNGHLHKGFKPVHWCMDCGSALAEAEVEYQNKTSPSIDVVFLNADPQFATVFPALNNTNAPLTAGVVIWTTTPWTLPSNQAVALHPDFMYSLVKPTDKSVAYLVAKELVKAFAETVQLADYEIVGECVGKALDGFRLQHPFYDKTVPIALGEHVTLDSGTGCVHTAPAHGVEDYALGEKYHLLVESLVGSNGCFFDKTPLFAGEHVFKANDKIIDVLKERGALLACKKIEHSYPHCWRHQTPLIFRATQQWFISMDQKGLRGSALSAIKTVEWIPSWGEARIEGMVKDRPDWCISRQRTWGVPLGIFFDRETGDLHPKTVELSEMVAKRIEQSGIEAWHELTLSDLLPEGSARYEKSTDLLDVWFESGVSHYCVLEKNPELRFPADLYLEGSDQHRGWFQSSLLTSVAMKNTAPFKQVLTHGFTVDELGRKMSKSLGNGIEPEEIFKTLGADVLRLWVSATDYRSEMTVSNAILKQISDIYRRVRNTARFLLANLEGFVFEEHQVAAKDLLALDQYIIERTRVLQNEILKAYEDYQFHVVYQKIHHYCAIELGSFYLDIIKDRQYTCQANGLPRRSAQTALYYMTECLVRWMAPLLSFTAEEIWQHLPGRQVASVFLTEWYQDLPVLDYQTSHMQESDWRLVISVRNEVNKILEEARALAQIGSGLEAEVDLYCEASIFASLAKLGQELRFILITSRADVFILEEKNALAKETGISGLMVALTPSTHAKCERCWHLRSDVGSHPEHPSICLRCVENIVSIGEKRQYA
jgi:isoleucyl-tRNA synthetase